MKLLLLTFALFGSDAWADSDNSWREQHNNALEQLKSHPSYMELEAQPSPTRAGMLRSLEINGSTQNGHHSICLDLKARPHPRSSLCPD